MTGADLRAEREAVGVHAAEVAAYLDRHPTALVQLERRAAVDEFTVRRYRRALGAARLARQAARRALLRELAAAT